MGLALPRREETTVNFLYYQSSEPFFTIVLLVSLITLDEVVRDITNFRNGGALLGNVAGDSTGLIHTLELTNLDPLTLCSMARGFSTFG
jgi:hypothetical protein